MSSTQLPAEAPPPDIPALPPFPARVHESGTAAAAAAELAVAANAEGLFSEDVSSPALGSPPEEVILQSRGESGTDCDGHVTVAPMQLLATEDGSGLAGEVEEPPGEAAAQASILADFPAKIPTVRHHLGL